MNNNRVVYLLGAGASCGNRTGSNSFGFGSVDGTVLPLVSEFAHAASRLTDAFKESLDDGIGGKVNKIPEEFNWLKDELLEVSERVKTSFSVDTIARMQKLSNNKPELNRIKNYIGIVLEYYEVLHGLDNRYEAFLSTIIKEVKDDAPIFPSNLSILSWNYDLQIERYMGKIGVNRIDEAIRKNEWLTEGFSLNKLNGDYLTEVNQQFLFNNLNGSIEEAPKLLKYRATNSNSLTSYDLFENFGFAWDFQEKGVFQDSVMNNISELVAVGYSFPSFNRQTDNRILKRTMEEAFKNKHEVRIIIQAAGASQDIANKVNERLYNLNNQTQPQLVKAVPYEESREFYLSNYIE